VKIIDDRFFMIYGITKKGHTKTEHNKIHTRLKSYNDTKNVALEKL